MSRITLRQTLILKFSFQKGKASIAAQRTERLARTNPARIERQIADLHSRQASEGSLPARDRRQLADLERDLERIQKARKDFPSGRREGGSNDHGGPRGTKRNRDGEHRGPLETNSHRNQRESSEETDDSVRNIPMPRDTPPPIPIRRRGRGNRAPPAPSEGSGDAQRGQEAELPQPAESKTVYEAKPVLKDLRKEAAGFVPSAVRKKINESQGKGGKLLEAEEMDRLEAQGYGVQPKNTTTTGPVSTATATASTSDGGDDRKEASRSRQVEMEEVSDEDL